MPIFINDTVNYLIYSKTLTVNRNMSNRLIACKEIQLYLLIFMLKSCLFVRIFLSCLRRNKLLDHTPNGAYRLSGTQVSVHEHVTRQNICFI